MKNLQVKLVIRFFPLPYLQFFLLEKSSWKFQRVAIISLWTHISLTIGGVKINWPLKTSVFFQTAHDWKK